MTNHPPMPDGDKIYRISDAAPMLRVSEKTVRRMIDAGQLHSFKLRGLRLIRESDLQSLIPGPAHAGALK